MGMMDDERTEPLFPKNNRLFFHPMIFHCPHCDHRLSLYFSPISHEWMVEDLDRVVDLKKKLVEH